MATTTEARPDPPLPQAKPPGAGRNRPIRGFELWAWLFMRISGIVLLFLAVGHVLIMHVFDTHGVNGIRMIVLDYVRPAGVRLAINSFFTVLGGALMALGTIIVVTFDPADWPAP
jgi:succinate dehydrogenase / fumarate reductase membrane anchor subunit